LRRKSAAIIAEFWQMDLEEAFSLKPRPFLIAISPGLNYENTNPNA
jgi:hypothetical protein